MKVGVIGRFATTERGHVLEKFENHCPSALNYQYTLEFLNLNKPEGHNKNQLLCLFKKLKIHLLKFIFSFLFF